ncbi:MAG TPA: prolyl oligopeptidase family serine peptidase, partial [Gemmatimonadales bacterium]|nr:prolyl oligopeptidase family serine peptidase [Gemmatimonadales bacterium]
GAAAPPRRTYGAPLLLRNLETGIAERFNDVLAYTFDDSAKVLAYTVVSRDSTADGAFFRNLRTGLTVTLARGRGNYKNIALDRTGTQVAFLSDRDEFGGGRDKARFTLYHATIKGGGGPARPARRAAVATEAATPIVASGALAEGQRIADNAGVSFSEPGNAVRFGIAPPVPDSVPADSLVGKSMFDLWHWKDPALQPSQRLSAARDRTRSFQAIYFPGNRRLVQLSNDSIPTVGISDDARFGLATSRERYRIESMWGDGGTDVYALDPASGSTRLVREKISGQAQLSPDGKYILFFDRGRWYAYATGSGRTVDLTGPIAGVSFEQETWDTPSIPGAWGIAGWIRGDRSVLIYDRWDVWELDPAGSRPPVMVTDSVGRAGHLVLRVVQTGRGRRGGGGGPFGGGGSPEPFGPDEPLLIRAVDDETRASGFYSDRLGARVAPAKVVMADAAFGAPVKAEDAEVWMVSRGTFVEFPDLWTGPALDSLSRISDANPQQKEYQWGTVELVRWTSSDGIPLKGLLYKPENFDSTRKYPLIAYFYESLSQNRHSYIAPNGRNVINPTHYVSNGYLIFEPDIRYEEGYPGPSALKSIVPGVQSLLARGFVDPKRLGLQGQSWGGYQTSYLITQTGMFAAAMAGAPVVNMTSAYGGIRWGSGLARAFQYEIGQSRIGGSLWEAPLRYVENSPLFWLDKVTTPLLLMHNDMDDAVPWYQGIEFFVAMRRLGKEVYLVNYNNDVHNPASRANQKDIAMRMQQFFDAKLKGAPPPDWMVRGIPYLAKGRDQLRA